MLKFLKLTEILLRVITDLVQLLETLQQLLQEWPLW